jgi:hypothetical protein
MTAKQRNRKLAKKGKKASASASDDPATAAAAAANQGEKATVDEAQHQLQQFQIGNDDNATTTTTCSHGLFLPHDAIDKMKETLTKQVLASCDDLVLAKTPCVFQAIDRFIIGDCGADLVSSPYPSSKGLMTLITSYFEKLMEEKEPNIEKMGFVIVMFFAHMDHEDKVTSTAISQWVPSHFVAAGARCLIQGDVETAHAYAYFNCYFEQLGSLLKQKKQFDITKMIEMRNADVRTIVSYFRKRIPCSCLDRRYKEVKSTKKIGFCFNPICSNIPDPKSVLCCSRCRQANYCSSACQAADWNFHKKVCVQFKNVGSAIKEVAGDMNDASMTYEDFKKKEYFKDCNEQTIFDTVKKNFEENTESSVREIGTG